MKTKSESTLKLALCNVGYSEKTVDKILAWYTFPKKKEHDCRNRLPSAQTT